MLGAGALAVPAGSVCSAAQGWVCCWGHVLVRPILPPPVQMAVDGSRAAVAPGVAQLFSAGERAERRAPRDSKELGCIYGGVR